MFSKDQLRHAADDARAFCRTAQTQLSALLRTVVEIESPSADQMAYGEFVNSLPNPSLITITRWTRRTATPCSTSTCRSVFSIIDRLVGGPGTHRPRLRELTEIEVALMGNVTDVFLNAFGEAWESVAPLRMRTVATEMNPQFAQVVPHSTMS